MRESADHEMRYTAATWPRSEAMNLQGDRRCQRSVHHNVQGLTRGARSSLEQHIKEEEDRAARDSLARAPVPQLDGIVKARAGDVLAVRAERDVVDLLLVAREARDGLFRVGRRRRRVDGRPQEERVVVRARDELLGRARGEGRVALEGEFLGCERVREGASVWEGRERARRERWTHPRRPSWAPLRGGRTGPCAG